MSSGQRRCYPPQSMLRSSSPARGLVVRTASEGGTVSASSVGPDGSGATIRPRVRRRHHRPPGLDGHRARKFLSIASIGGVRALARSGIGPLLADVEGACFKPPPAKRSPSRARGKSRFRRMRWIMPSKHAAVLPPQWRSSMARNLEDGRRLEVDALSGAVVRRGAKLGIPTPLHLTIAACCRCISPDEEGRPWDRGCSETSPARRRAARCRSLQSTASRAPAATWRPSQGCPAGYRDRDDSRVARLILSCLASRAIPAFLRLLGAPVSSSLQGVPARIAVLSYRICLTLKTCRAESKVWMSMWISRWSLLRLSR